MHLFLKKLFALLAFTLVHTVTISAPSYDMSDAMIKSSHLRSKYYLTSSFLDLGTNFHEFIGKADKSKGVVVHSHGCSGVTQDEHLLRSFYTDLGLYFVLLDFNKRGDAQNSCTVSGGNLTYHDEPRLRLPPRVQELRNHVKRLRDEGFQTIFITGHSEGGMVVQLFPDEVNGAIIHSMSCVPGGTRANNLKNRYLHLVSLNDPLLNRAGISHTCSDRPNYSTWTSSVMSHGALADPSWREKIREFLDIKN